MKILALNGSHRGAKGCTQTLLDKIAEGAREAGAQFDLVVLAERKINMCCGCELCHTEGEHYLRCIYEKDDDVKDVFDQMRDADIIIYASPVYVFNISGLMKTFLDRLNSTAGTGKLGVNKNGLFFGTVDEKFHSKPFVVLTCCGNVEQETVKNVISYFQTFAKFLDAPIAGTLIRNMAGALEPGSIPNSPKQQKLIDGVLNAYIQAGRDLAAYGKIAASTERAANKNLLGIPFFDFLLKFRWFKELAIKKKNNTASSPP